jgi:uncharacterized protein DUF2752
MQVSYRHLRPNETDHELIWLTVSLGSLGVAALWLWLGLPWPRCVLHDLTGLPCVTCGATRSAIEFFHGHFVAALNRNPLVFVALCGVVAFDLYAFAVVATRAPRLRFVCRNQAERQYARAILIVALALNWIYLLSHWRQL